MKFSERDSAAKDAWGSWLSSHRRWETRVWLRDNPNVQTAFEGGFHLGVSAAEAKGAPASQLLDVTSVVRALNADDEERKHNLLARFARDSGATYGGDSGRWSVSDAD